MSLYKNVNAYEQISSFYPRWYLDIYEMNEILKIESLVATNIQNAIDLILDDHFLDTINEDKVTELEKYLGITSSTDRTIEERRNLIKTYFLGRGKLSVSQLVAIVKALSGGEVTGSFSQGNSNRDNYIKLKISKCDIKNTLLDIISTLKDRVPAHLWVELYYEPRKVENYLSHKEGAYNYTYNVISSIGRRNEDATSAGYVKCVQYHSSSDVISFELSLLYGGNFEQAYEDITNGGGYATNNEDYINGNY